MTTTYYPVICAGLPISLVRQSFGWIELHKSPIRNSLQSWTVCSSFITEAPLLFAQSRWLTAALYLNIRRLLPRRHPLARLTIAPPIKYSFLIVAATCSIIVESALLIDFVQSCHKTGNPISQPELSGTKTVDPGSAKESFQETCRKILGSAFSCILIFRLMFQLKDLCGQSILPMSFSAGGETLLTFPFQGKITIAEFSKAHFKHLKKIF